MNWTEYVHTDPNILLGKPVVKGIRLSVDFILRLFGKDWRIDQVFESYPQLSAKALQAVFAYAADSLSQERL